MNKFKKFCPNVWVAECEEEYKKGDIITLVTKYNNHVECEVFNLINQKDGLFYYSIVRVDESYAERRAERYRNSAANHAVKSHDFYEKSQEGKEFLSLGEPIKVGHHSEKRHRALIERNNNRMGKCIEHRKLSENAERKAEYWDSRANNITLALPECYDFFKYKLDKAIELQKGLKDGSIPRTHSYSLPYATKNVKELKKKLEIAELLWGDNDGH